jgi:hypothetical protein
MKIKHRLLLCSAMAASAGLATVSSLASAQEAEDSSAAFQAQMDGLAASLGLPAAESTVTTNANGTLSARMGLSAMKMLVVKQQADGSISYAHVGSAEEARAFDQVSGNSNGPAEE